MISIKCLISKQSPGRTRALVSVGDTNRLTTNSATAGIPVGIGVAAGDHKLRSSKLEIIFSN
jgi:hypothetical protein